MHSGYELDTQSLARSGGFGDGQFMTLQQVFAIQYPSPQGGKLIIEGRDGQKVVVVKELGQWARYIRLGTTYPNHLFRCAVALCFKVQIILQHLYAGEEAKGALASLENKEF